MTDFLKIEPKAETVDGYTAFKNELDRAMIQATEDFVYIGYLLGKAKDDPGILEGSGYESYKDFAASEYGLEESQVSRFIAIHEKYGEEGRLLPQYKGYGQSKLAEMLSLPEVIVQEIPKDITREEIRKIKREIKEDEKVTPLEVYMQPPAKGETMADKVIHEFFRKYRELFIKAATLIKYNDENWESELKEFFMPAGETADTVRISGIGAVVFTFKSSEIVFLQNRTQEREVVDWKTWGGALNTLFAHTGEPSRKAWEIYYGEPFEENAPAHMEKKDEEKEKPSKAPEEEKKEERPKTAAEAVERYRESKLPEAEENADKTEEYTEKPVGEDNKDNGKDSETEESEKAITTAEGNTNSKPEEPALASQNKTLIGYKAAISENLNKLCHVWNDDISDISKTKLMLGILEVIKWRLELIADAMEEMKEGD